MRHRLLAAAAALAAIGLLGLPAAPALADPPHNPNNAITESCKLVEVSAGKDLLIVKCATSQITARALAIEPGDPAADKIATIAAAALLANHLVRATFLTWPDKNPQGCFGDCRRLLGMALRP